MSEETSIRDQTMNNKRLLPENITSQQEARKLLKTQPEQEPESDDDMPPLLPPVFQPHWNFSPPSLDESPFSLPPGLVPTMEYSVCTTIKKMRPTL